MLEFDAGELAFFVGVLIVWFLVGRAYDRRGPPKTTLETRVTAYGVFLNICLAIVGAFSFVGGTILLPNAVGTRRLRVVVAAVLCFLWSLTLIVGSTMRLAKGLRRRDGKPGISG